MRVKNLQFKRALCTKPLEYFVITTNKMRKSKFGLIIALLIAFFGFQDVQAAYLKNVPVTKTQPDGTVIHCFTSGDEYFNYLHDADGYTIMQHPSTGYYVYAEKRDGKLVATEYVVGKFAPASKGLKPYAIISPEEWMARRRAMEMNNRPNRNRTTNQGVLNNIAIFIRFSDDNEFSNTFSSIDDMFNDESQNAVSMINYFKSASYNTITIPTHFYPGHSGETIISYQDIYPKNYYEPYNAITNPNGYTEEQRGEREFSLLERAVNYVNIYYPIPTNLNIDHDNDGEVDNVCFIVKGDVGGWNELLWPHMWALQDRTVTINGKRVWTYNFQLADATDHFNTSTMCHEMNHSLGAPDLYHYSYSGSDPVGSWDLMNINTTPPQHCGAYMKMEYGHWIDEIPEITQAGTYTLNPISSATPTNIAYKIASSDPNQFYVLEYRNTNTPFESALPGSGLLIYRIDTRFVGNEDYNPDNGVYDEVYIFRPYGSFSNEGDLDNAHFNSNENRTEFGPQTNPYPFFSEGTVDNSFRVYDITSAASTISFRYEPLVQHTITAIANPTAGGIISGAGTYNENSECTLVATPNAHYAFMNWTKNGIQVSTDPTYTFTVTNDGAYVANFTQKTPYPIVALTFPTEGGTVTGSGTYYENSECTLTAIPNENYTFQYWSYANVILSHDPTYTFTVEKYRVYQFTANFAPINAHTETIGQLNYSLNDYDLTATVIGHKDGEDASGNLTIPSSVSYTDDFDNTWNYSVISIGNCAFKECSGLTGNLVVPSSVTSIGREAFRDCSGFTGTLTIPDAMISIGSYAFLGCSGLTGNLTIPNSVIGIGRGAFRDCSGFTGALFIPNSVIRIENNTFYGCSELTSLTLESSVTSVGDLAFGNCSGLNTVYWNAVDLEIILETYPPDFSKEHPFRGCTSLTTVMFGELVQTIPNRALYQCAGISLVTIGNSVTTIGASAFSGCSGLTGELVIPNSVTSIGANAFSGCSGLTGELVIPNSVTSIGAGAFRGCNGLTGDLIIPGSVTSISPHAFEGCAGGNLIISNGVISIGEYAFYDCSGFTGTLSIGNSLTEIGYAAFQNCSGFSGDLIIPNSVTFIDEYAFCDCSGFDGTLTLPDALTKISHAAFANCGFVGELVLPNTITSIELNAFNGCSGFSGNLVIPNSVTKIENGAFRNCSGFTGDLVIPNSVTIIGGTSYNFGVFDGCSGFNGNLMIGNSMTAIDNYTFQGCSGLTGDVVIPNSVNYIGRYAFSGCSGLTGDLVIPNSVNYIGRYAFSGCSGLTGDLVIPNSVTTIDESTFSDCSGFDGDLSIPIYVTSIGANAFASCNNLSSIHSYNAVPPTLGNNAFNGVNTSIPVYVPSCSATDYSQAARWSNFTNYQATLPCVPTFTGNGTDNLWSNPDNWSAQPDGNYDIIISANCEVNEDVEASSVIINNTGTLVVKSGHVLTISGNSSKSGNTLEGEIVNHGTAANLIIEDGGQLVYNQNGLQGTIQKNISYYTLEGNDGWHLVAYPLVENGSVSSQSNMLNNSYDLYYYDEPTHYWRNYKNASNSFTQLEAGKGYLYANSGVITPIGTRVGSGTGATAYSPFYTYYKFSISENLFRATELETAGLSTSPLGSLCWYATNSTGYEQSGISIWMANVSDSELTETSHLTDGMTLVYTGSMTPVVGWNEFVFNENTFAWDGTSNILVCVQRNNGQWNDKIYWQTHNPGFASKSQQYTDDAAYDMTTQTYSMSVSTNYRPNTIFKTVSEVGVVEQTPIQISFAGELENGAANINLPLSYTESAGGLKGFNLVGNPFVHNVTSFVRTNVAEECYRMNAAKDNLIVSEVSASKPLKPAEGFFVKATAEGASITFNSGAKGETNRSGRINIELRENDPSTSSGTLLIDRLIVKRKGEPLEKMSLKENGTRIFAANGNQEMAVVTAEGEEQAVSFKAAKNGIYTLNANVENLSVDYLHLIDNLTGNDIDLLATPSYTFTAKMSDYASRFRLVFSEEGGASTSSATTNFAYINNGEIVLANAEASTTLQIVDMMGRVIVNTDAAHHVSTAGIPAGVYVLRLINGNDVKTQKIVIK